MIRGLVAACALAVVGASAAWAAVPRGPDDVPAALVAQAARMLCQSEASELGREAFAEKYGAGRDGVRACLSAREAEAEALASTAFAACRAEHGSDRRALRTCAVSRLRSAVGRPPPPAVVAQAARMLCQAEARELGREAFAEKYGTGRDGRRACLSERRAEAYALARATFDSCLTEDPADRRAAIRCAVSRIRAASAQSPPRALVAQAARLLCRAEARELGRAGFTAKYGSGSAGRRACLAAQAPRATAITADALAACRADGGDRRAVFRCAVDRIRKAAG